MTEDLADALAAFRATNYERIYLRPHSITQARAVVEVLQALVEHYAAHPERVPGDSAHVPAPHGADALRAAVTYVAGMTDRFACQVATAELGWPSERLPRGLRAPG